MCRVYSHDILLCDLVTLTLMQEIGVCVWGGGGVGYHIWLQLLLEWTQLLSNFGSLPHSKWVSVCVFLCFFPVSNDFFIVTREAC